MKIDLITLLAEDVPGMVAFYRDVLGFTIKQDMGDYVELNNEGVRFALCSRTIMYQATSSEEYRQMRRGQAVELAFPCETAADVDELYEKAVAAGAGPVAAPADMPWGQRAAFFSDPEGNIHEFFSTLDI